MEELKILVEAISELPDLAIWAVAMYFFFKLVVVGSIYGVIRFVAQKIHDVNIKKKEPDMIVKQHNIILDGKLISSLRAEPSELIRLFDRMIGTGTTYIFDDDITKVHKALDAYEKKD